MYHYGGVSLACAQEATRSRGHDEPTVCDSACESGFPGSNHAYQQGLGTAVAFAVCPAWPQ